MPEDDIKQIFSHLVRCSSLQCSARSLTLAAPEFRGSLYANASSISFTGRAD